MKCFICKNIKLPKNNKKCASCINGSNYKPRIDIKINKIINHNLEIDVENRRVF